ncbi:WD repeat, SAM and U-box domain-containing protein 1 isoform X1 [Astyanax mexicanus]|uniref:WD repeat, SAM and U-box domain-containing protein 1 isoform X1 n=1 Tax=Astyanax mexicanus TaxID=7994 RepID=UPI0020CAFBB8|nr:WD repeat, SAM and U-box domain-containing protein 1 isoform X1 [Astyanax mexicanus]XP_049335024.1 WD repeat, SAM and U-box domain-containing protein 1 isoform X1 [Astyanax mexicanus]XP_049335026.1 WD repeat, SAM and U-box domain-containing protein 1 isoform X1 [Astyanax mexicanus]
MVSLICSLQNHLDDVNWCAFSSTLLATCSADKTIRVYSTRDFTELSFSPLSGHGYGVHCCCFSPCGQYLASCSTDATTVVWKMDTGEIEAVFEHPGRSPVRVCAFSPDSSWLVSGASDGSLALWDFPSRALLRSTSFSFRTGSVPDTTMVACSFTPCGQLFASGSTYGDLRIWDLSMNQLHAEKYAHDLGVTCCQFAPQMMKDMASSVIQFRLASCGQDSLLKIWLISRVSTTGCKMQLVHTLSGQSATVLSCAYSADGQLLVSGSMDKTVAVYEANDGSLLYKLNQHERYVTSCAFSPTAPLIATGSMDKTVNVWMVEDGSSSHESGKSLPDEAAFASHEAGRKWPGHSRLMVSEWSEDDVLSWLREEGLESLIDTFKANNIDGAELLSLSKESLSTDLRIESLGLRSKVLRKIEELRTAPVSNGIPDEFLCPITHEIMKDPVIAADGYSYEREAIESWINTKTRSSPMTNLPLQTTLLTPNRTLKMAICRWTSSQ